MEGRCAGTPRLETLAGMRVPGYDDHPGAPGPGPAFPAALTTPLGEKAAPKSAARFPAALTTPQGEKGARTGTTPGGEAEIPTGHAEMEPDE